MNFGDMQRYFELYGDGKDSEAEQLREKYISNRLVKFFWLDGSENDEKRFNTLRGEELWFSSVNRLNDPYEFKGMIIEKKKWKRLGLRMSI